MVPVITIVPIVEGHGDAKAVPLLLKRMANEKKILVTSAHPIIAPSSQMRKRVGAGFGIAKQLELALRRSRDCDAIFIFIDADCTEPICEFYPKFSAYCTSLVPPEIPVCIVFPKKEYETWFLAGITSLFPQTSALVDVEDVRDAKGKLEELSGASYSELEHQEEYTKKVDLTLVRQNSKSFNKFEREYDKLVKLYHRKYGLATSESP